MNTVEVLNSIKDFIQEKITEHNILMQQEETNLEEIYVNPYVEVCHMPHKNFMPLDFQVPYVLVMLDEESDDGDDNDIAIRLVFAAYGGGMYIDAEGNQTNIPDAKGYVDLLNLMDRVKQDLVTTAIIKNKTALRKPYKKGMYDTENTWPYWYGFSTFSVVGIVENYLMKELL